MATGSSANGGNGGRKNTFANSQSDGMDRGHSVSQTLVSTGDDDINNVVDTGTYQHENPRSSTTYTGLSREASSLMTFMEAHMTVCSEGQEYNCSVCGKCFLRKSSLEIHSRTHTGEKPYTCQTCGKSFSVNGNLKKHSEIHDREKKHVCEECGESFYKLSDMNIHMSIHTGEKPHTCKICKKEFSRRSSLRNHIIIHTGEKPYKCSECGRSFARVNGLKLHARTHTGEQPYICSECGKAFSQRGNLKTHQKTHEIEVSKYEPKQTRSRPEISEKLMQTLMYQRMISDPNNFLTRVFGNEPVELPNPESKSV